MLHACYNELMISNTGTENLIKETQLLHRGYKILHEGKMNNYGSQMEIMEVRGMDLLQFKHHIRNHNLLVYYSEVSLKQTEEFKTYTKANSAQEISK